MHGGQLAEHQHRERGQAQRAHAHQAAVDAQTALLLERQRQAEQRQKAALLANAAAMNPGLQQARLPERAVRRPSPEQAEQHEARAHMQRPALVNAMRDWLDEDKPVEPSLVTRESFGRKATPQVVEVVQVRPPPAEADSDEEHELEERQEAVRRQNEAIRAQLDKLKSQQLAQSQAAKFQSEVDKLNALEAKLFDYGRHVESVKALSRLGDDLGRMARAQALASIKAGQMRKDAEARALMKALAEQKQDRGSGKDPWARKMIQALAKQQQQPGMPAMNPAFFSPPVMPSPKVERSVDSAEQRRQEKRIKKLNAELEKKNKMLDNLKQKDDDKPKEDKDKGLMNKDEVAAAIEQALKKQADELEKKAKEVGAGPEDIVTLPNGVSVIRPKDKTKPPIFVMPDDPVQKLKEKMEKTKSSFSSSSSVSESIPPKPNPLQQMMLGMLMSQNMRMMMGDDESSAPSRKSRRSRKSTSSSQSHLPPIIINPPPVYQPPAPMPVMPTRPLPHIDSAKPKRQKAQVQSMGNLPAVQPQEPTPRPVLVQPYVQPIAQPYVQPVAQPVAQPYVQLPPVRPQTGNSESVDGQPLQPPVRMGRLADVNPWNIEPPKPSQQVDISRSPSLRDQQAPPQCRLV